MKAMNDSYAHPRKKLLDQLLEAEAALDAAETVEEIKRAVGIIIKVMNELTWHTEISRKD